MEESFISETQASEMLGINRRTLIRYRRSGRINPAAQTRREVLYRLEQLLTDLINNARRSAVSQKAEQYRNSAENVGQRVCTLAI